MTVLNAMRQAMPQASTERCAKQCQNEMSWQSTDGRTNELTKKSKTSRDTSLTDTCARVQDFDDLKKRTAERKPEPTRELRDPAQVINAHLEESA